MTSPRLSVHDELAQRIHSGALELPLLSDTASQVMALCGDASCDARRLSELIQRDPSLAGHVLRVANSVAYAPTERIVSLQQAVSRMGLSAMRDIALAIAVKSKVFTAPGFEPEIRELWIHSIGAAAWAKEIARLRRRNVEGAFLAGLMHDIGRPVVLHAALDVLREAREPVDRTTLRAWLDEMHTEVGSMLLERWSMPDWMQAATRWHHEPALAPDDAAETAAIVSLADHFTHWAQGDGRASEAAIRSHPSLARLSLYADDIDELFARREQVSTVSRALG